MLVTITDVHYSGAGVDCISHDKCTFPRLPLPIIPSFTHPDYVRQGERKHYQCVYDIPPFRKVIEESLSSGL